MFCYLISFRYVCYRWFIFIFVCFIVWFYCSLLSCSKAMRLRGVFFSLSHMFFLNPNYCVSFQFWLIYGFRKIRHLLPQSIVLVSRRGKFLKGNYWNFRHRVKQESIAFGYLLFVSFFSSKGNELFSKNFTYLDDANGK